MGKLVSFLHVSLDGYMAGPNGEIDWIIFDDELNDYVVDVRQTADATVYGRVTYQMMESYWPTVLTDPNAGKNALDYAQWVDKKLKVVVSTTLPSVSWNNTTLIKNSVAGEISRLKKELPGELLLLGSGTLHQSLLQMGLIDEFRLTLNPIVLGSGIPLFKDIKDKLSLQLLDTKQFSSGVMALHYKVNR